MPRHICSITCFLCVTMGFVHDEYSLMHVESLLVYADPFVNGKCVYHDGVNCRFTIFHILSSMSRLCWHDLFLSREKFLFVSFNHYSLVIRTHMGWHMWPIFLVVISLVPSYCATPLLTCVIHHTCDAVLHAEPVLSSRYQSIGQILHRFTGYSMLAS